MKKHCKQRAAAAHVPPIAPNYAKHGCHRDTPARRSRVATHPLATAIAA